VCRAGDECRWQGTVSTSCFQESNAPPAGRSLLVLHPEHHCTGNETEPVPDSIGKELTERAQRRKRESECKTTTTTTKRVKKKSEENDPCLPSQDSGGKKRKVLSVEKREKLEGGKGG
jgi:hypothetical protein